MENKDFRPGDYCLSSLLSFTSNHFAPFYLISPSPLFVTCPSFSSFLLNIILHSSLSPSLFSLFSPLSSEVPSSSSVHGRIPSTKAHTSLSLEYIGSAKRRIITLFLFPFFLLLPLLFLLNPAFIFHLSLLWLYFNEIYVQIYSYAISLFFLPSFPG